MVEDAHGELVPVKVYVVIPMVAVFITAGDQVPDIPSNEGFGNNGGALF